ncbi:MAG: ROK family protein [Bacteroidota bacterium]
MKILALDLGGTRIKIGVVEQEKILESRVVEALSDRGFLPRLTALEPMLVELLHDPRFSRGDIRGIGLSVPGIVDSKVARVLSINQKYNDIVGFDFRQWSDSTFGLPLFLENDARAALAGEWQFGSGKGCDNLVMVTLGTGVGAAALMEGELLRGKHFQAGCLGGHFTIAYEGQTCNCGNIGCVESEASSWRLASLAVAEKDFATSGLSKAPTIDYEVLFRLAANNDPLSQRLVHRSLLAWSAGVINLIHAYDPERAIIGGGMMRSAERIIPFIADQVARRAWTPWGKVHVVKAQDIDNAALLGVAHLLSESLRGSL